MIAFACLLTGCEAPLDLGRIQEQRESSIQRYDNFQAVAVIDEKLVAVSSTGSVVMSEDRGKNWSRTELPNTPAIIDVAACPDGAFHALDTARKIWSLKPTSNSWVTSVVETDEAVLSISCTPGNQLWIGAGFATMLSSVNGGESWNQQSLDDDLQITAIDFVDAATGFAFGEFGVFLTTTDGGINWDRNSDIPNEFYPMAADFASVDVGWVGGLDGVFWRTQDGGETWQREVSPTKAPIYGILATPTVVFAVGGSGTILERSESGWTAVNNAPATLAFLRGIARIGDEDLLIAGGAGSVFVLPTNAELEGRDR
mgnify:CR=1 FL=1